MSLMQEYDDGDLDMMFGKRYFFKTVIRLEIRDRIRVRVLIWTKI